MCIHSWMCVCVCACTFVYACVCPLVIRGYVHACLCGDLTMQFPCIVHLQDIIIIVICRATATYCL